MGRRTLAGLLLALGSAAWPPPASGQGASKVSPEVLAHWREKLEVRAAAPRAGGEGLPAPAASDPAAERCALYATRRLQPEEIAELARQGLSIHPWAWVPPVPGRHPHGYHLAVVRYESLETIEADPRFTRVESVEARGHWLNDLAGAMVGVPEVHEDLGVTGRAVRVAVGDTGFDLSHEDLPVPAESFDVTTGGGPDDWSTEVRDPFLGHGTHVAGTLLGRGILAGGRYRGIAPGALLHAYRLGDNVFTMEDAIESLLRASEVGCRVYSGSWGFFTPYLDGSDPLSQAVDAAAAGGMVSFFAAGNEADKASHAQIEVLGGEAAVSFTLDNARGAEPYRRREEIQVVWREGPAAGDLSLVLDAPGAGESLEEVSRGTSPRFTRGIRYVLHPRVEPGETRSYRLVTRNRSPCAANPVHLYRTRGRGTFDRPDPRTTVLVPALADSAVAVGAWTSRVSYTNARGEIVDHSEHLRVGTLAPFSSRGPRVDGRLKPDLIAPGAWTISCLDSQAFSLQTPEGEALQVEEVGYVAFSGTSMAAPVAAGVAALLLEADPSLAPSQVALALAATASAAAAPNSELGHGLIDALAALRLVSGGAVPRNCDLQGPARDCNQNGLPDRCELEAGREPDCNANDLPDSCELAEGRVSDCDRNGVPDTCDLAARFAFGPPRRIAAGERPFALAGADLDSDGHQDIAAASLLSSTVSILLGDGGGGLKRAQEVAVGSRPVALVAADLDGDGRCDLVTANRLGRSLSIVQAVEKGGLAAARDVPLALAPGALAVLALDGDDLPDLAALSAAGEAMELLVHRPGGGFLTQAVATGASGQPVALAAGDLDGDGGTDLAAIASRTLLVLPSREGWQPEALLRRELEGPASGLELGDLDRDGDLDLAVVSESCRALSLLENDGRGAFFSLPARRLEEAPAAVAMADLDRNGLEDVLVLGPPPGALSVLWRYGAGGARWERAVGEDGGRGRLLVLDLDGDSWLDAVASDPDTTDLVVLAGGGAAGAHGDCNRNGVPDGCDLAGGASADVNANGVPDECDPGTRFIRGDCDGDGRTGAPIADAVTLLRFNYAGGRRPGCLAACDTDADGAVEGMVTDAVALLLFHFQGGPPPGPPFPACGLSPPETESGDRRLGCEVPPAGCGG